jgi:CDP-6-deoxy-D-xylo-4-hexulose-3-dehydrase
MGYNLKPLDLQGAIGLVQLDKIKMIHEKRRSHKQKLEEIFLQNISEISIPQELTNAETSWFGLPIVCNNKLLKQNLVSWLESKKVQTRNYFAGNILLHPAYCHLDDYRKYPNSNQVLDRVFWIGVSPLYGDKVFEYISEILENFDE